jgi:spore maturation protein CgeB
LRFVFFCHSLVSDWNHGNAHFLRGVVSELISRGHDVRVFEPRTAWSVENLLKGHGYRPIKGFYEHYPALDSYCYDRGVLDLDWALQGADMVIVHEWNDPEMVRLLGRHHERNRVYRLLFHDTHHRSVTDAESMAKYDLSGYDGVLAFGGVIRDIYLRKGWTERAWTWHEAADTRVFRPMEQPDRDGDLVWVGNWGDGERSAELREFLLEPARDLRLRTRVFGVRYPGEALSALKAAGASYGGWLPNYAVPEVFSRYSFTVHVPRRPYTTALPGIPTIRVFEALACGIPLICAPWEDAEGLFSPGEDFLVARNGSEMRQHMRAVMSDGKAASMMALRGHTTVISRHTCAHRVDELLSIHEQISPRRNGKHNGHTGAVGRLAGALAGMYRRK